MNAKLTKSNADDQPVVPQMTANMKVFVCGQRLHQQGFVSSFDGSKTENNYWSEALDEKYFGVI